MVDERDPGPQVRARLTYLLKHALLELGAMQDELLSPVGISGRELGVLLLLDGREPESQQQAASRLGVDRTTMVALLDELERKGLVVRRADAADRRRNVVELTDHGRATLREATLASDEAERRLLAALDEDEATQLRKLLMRVLPGV